MARRKKGIDVHGWVLIDKPAGIGSTQVVSKVKYALKANKAGHGGTLDPAATGLLPVALGDATKLLPFLEDAPKTYDFEVIWGAETSTDDAEGEIQRESDLRPSAEDIEAILPQFRGLIEQVPPQVSAVKVDGQRAYDLARDGVEMTLKSRPLEMFKLELNNGIFTMTCGKGGYVRSIARDMGRALGCLGHVKWLRRRACLGFDVLQAQGLDADFSVIPIRDTPLIAHMDISEEDAVDLGHGRIIQCAEINGIFMAMCKNSPIAMVESQNGELRVLRGLSKV